MTVAVIPENGTEPVATFDDMDTALAWGLQQYKGKPFIVRVFTDDASESAPVAAQTPNRKPAARAVAQVLQAVDEELRGGGQATRPSTDTAAKTADKTANQAASKAGRKALAH